MTAPRPPRWFFADDILTGRVNLDGYPFRYLSISIDPAVTSPFSGPSGHAARIDSRPAGGKSSTSS